MPPTIQNFGIGCGKTDLLCSCQNKPFFHPSIPLRQDFCYLGSSLDSPFPPQELQVLSTSSLTQNTSKMTIMQLATHHKMSLNNRGQYYWFCLFYSFKGMLLQCSQLSTVSNLLYNEILRNNTLDLLSHIHYLRIMPQSHNWSCLRSISLKSIF